MTRKNEDYPPVTIDEALASLTAAKKELGGDACLILSLWDSELQDVNVKGFTVIHDRDNRYLQVDVIHPDLAQEQPDDISQPAGDGG